MNFISWLNTKQRAVVRNCTPQAIFEKTIDYFLFIFSLPERLKKRLEVNSVVSHSLNMIDVFVNDEHLFLTAEQQIHLIKQIKGLVNFVYDPSDMRTNNGTLHSCICDYLGIGRFVPAQYYKPYAIQSSKIEIWENGLMMKSLGGNYQCAFCCHNIDFKPVGQKCPQCNNSVLTNLGKSGKRNKQ
jgi:hypothetical protein